MKIFYLNNPASGNNNGAKYFSLIKKEFDKRNIGTNRFKQSMQGMVPR